jgi:NADH-quinone oxidoreductase subunit L
MFLTFYGEARGDKHTHDHAHESPMTMLVPLGVLAVGAVFPGMVWYNSFFGKTDQVATFFGVEYADGRGSFGWRMAMRTMAASHGDEAMATSWRLMAMRAAIGSPLRLHQPAGRGRDPRAPGQ